MYRTQAPSRALKAGPNVGFYEAFTASIAAASANVTIKWWVESDIRIVECSWVCQASTGAPTGVFSFDVTPDTGAGATAIHTGSPGMAANPTLVLRPVGTSPVLNASRVIPAGTALRFTFTAGGGTVTNLTVCMVGWRTAHALTLPSED